MADDELGPLLWVNDEWDGEHLTRRYLWRSKELGPLLGLVVRVSLLLSSATLTGRRRRLLGSLMLDDCSFFQGMSSAQGGLLYTFRTEKASATLQGIGERSDTRVVQSCNLLANFESTGDRFSDGWQSLERLAHLQGLGPRDVSNMSALSERDLRSSASATNRASRAA